jgi:hypothetical protein
MSPQVLLNVLFIRCLRTDLVIESISNGMRALDMEAVKALTVKYDKLDWPATYFKAAYMSLIRVLERPCTSALYKTPPHQVTIPPNPNFSKESDTSINSSSSTESKPEPFTEGFMHEFVNGVLCSIGDELAIPIPWLQQTDRFYLSMEYDLLLLH